MPSYHSGVVPAGPVAGHVRRCSRSCLTPRLRDDGAEDLLPGRHALPGHLWLAPSPGGAVGRRHCIAPREPPRRTDPRRRRHPPGPRRSPHRPPRPGRPRAGRPRPRSATTEPAGVVPVGHERGGDSRFDGADAQVRRAHRVSHPACQPGVLRTGSPANTTKSSPPHATGGKAARVHPYTALPHVVPGHFSLLTRPDDMSLCIVRFRERRGSQGCSCTPGWPGQAAGGHQPPPGGD